jgi:hypothetical protein
MRWFGGFGGERVINLEDPDFGTLSTSRRPFDLAHGPNQGYVAIRCYLYSKIKVIVFLFGLYYRLVPGAGATVLARIQGWLHIIGAILFPAGVALVILKGESFIAAPIAGSLIMTAAMALFTVIVFRSSRA